MSSTIIAKNIQIGTSGTATNNFNWYQPAAPDGTVRLGVGNYGATTLDAVTVSNSGNVTVAGSLAGGALSGSSLAVSGATTTGSLTVNNNAISAVNSMGFRNRLINSDMRIDQRNAGASVTVNNSANFYVVDRFFGTGQLADGVFTSQQSTTAPTGFRNSLIATVTTADASLGATQQYLIGQNIEGFNVADLGWGAAGAQTVTLSFWVRSSLPGTFGGSIVNSGFNRSYPFSYTISAANTFEYKTVTIAGDTSGTWLTDNGIGLRLLFSLGAGASYLGTAGSWSGSYFVGATGQTQVISTNGATFYITGVQLEAGSVATPFERRDYGRELAMCQRYYEKSYNIDVTPGTVTSVGSVYRTLDAGPLLFASPGPIFFKVTKRANPTVTLYGVAAGTSGAITVVTDLNGVAVNIGTNSAGCYVNNVSAGAAGSGCAAHFVASAEL